MSQPQSKTPPKTPTKMQNNQTTEYLTPQQKSIWELTPEEVIRFKKAPPNAPKKKNLNPNANVFIPKKLNFNT